MKKNNFFDNYQEFYKNAGPDRINYRYNALIQSNKDILNNSTILDLGSYDGRWSFAAIKNNAKKIIGIEGREELVKKSIENMKKYNIPEEKYHFIFGDVFNEIKKFEPYSFDVVFCFGFFYHIMNHMLLLSEIKRLKPKYLILDTVISSSEKPIVSFKKESVENKLNAIKSRLNNSENELVGIPSKRALELMLKNIGFTFQYFDWEKSGIHNLKRLDGYKKKKRISLVATRLISSKPQRDESISTTIHTDDNISLPPELTMEQEQHLEKNLVWVFSSPRSGSTWLANQLLSFNTHSMDEPYLGYHIASIQFFGGNPKLIEYHRNRNTYFFSDKFENTWKFYLRKLILNRIYSQYRDISKKIIIKEPNGSHGADKILNCLPSSKFIFVVRDGRDVIDSQTDAIRKNGWSTNLVDHLQEKDRLRYLRQRSKDWNLRMKFLLNVFEKHPSHLRLKLKYEDLLRNTLDELKKIYEFIDVKIPKNEIENLVECYNFKKIPTEKKGPGKVTRFARPGIWKENFSEQEKTILEKLIGGTLKKLGYT